MLDGFVFVDKQKGMTTRSIDNYFQKKFHTRKVGHLGTLDPFATGLVLVAINKGTKALSFLSDSKKTYIARLVLGKSTPSLDNETPINKVVPTKIYNKNEIEEAVSSLTNITSQVPPMYSAIKINGKPLYELARQGEEINRKEREVTIFESKLIYYSFPYVDFLVKVSKGTYIRTLGEELAKRLNTVGYLDKLRRIEVDDFSLIKAKRMENIEEKDIVSVKEVLSFMDSIEVDSKIKDDIKNGKKLCLDSKSDKVLLVYQDEVLAVYQRQEGNIFSSLRGLF